MTAPWHVSGPLARRYAAGAAPETDAWSLEKHVESCAPCASRVSAAVRAGTAGPALAAVRADLLTSLGRAPATAGGSPADTTAHPTADGTAARPDPVAARIPLTPGTAHSPVEPGTGRLPAAPGAARTPVEPGAAPIPLTPGTPRSAVPPGAHGAPVGRPLGRVVGRWARIGWAAGPALRGAWVVAVALVVGGAFALAHGAGFRGARSWLLAVSPLLPLAGVAVSYGRHADPLHEITAATPSGGLRLLLTRTAAVLAVCVPLLTAGGALLPPVAGFPGAAAWLLPGLALTLAALALGSFVGCRASAATLGGGWLLAVAGPLLGPQGQGAAGIARYFAGPAAQGAWAAAALVCAALLALRRRSFDHLESYR
ncbi:zf-HC2 domain-containing protein [Streptomyces sp. NPDC090082]|uniref:zf-HC2 domain-containing protein n=1 Tax=unclassified Streptomyces TaxID=2593676 RepID=UPI0037FDA9FA